MANSDAWSSAERWETSGNFCDSFPEFFIFLFFLRIDLNFLYCLCVFRKLRILQKALSWELSFWCWTASLSAVVTVAKPRKNTIIPPCPVVRIHYMAGAFRDGWWLLGLLMHCRLKCEYFCQSYLKMLFLLLAKNCSKTLHLRRGKEILTVAYNCTF